MNKDILGRLLRFVVNGITSDIVANANGLQQRLEHYIAKQTQFLDEKQVLSLLESGKVSIVKNELQKFFSRTLQYIKAGVNTSYQAGMTQYISEKSTTETEYEWVAKKGARHCPDCLSRDGDIETWDVWQMLGPPAAGGTLCLSNCRCRLVEVKKSPKK